MSDILALLVSERNKLNRAIEALGGDLGHAIIRLTKVAKTSPRGGRQTMSPESRARIAAAQRVWWAKTKEQNALAAKPGPVVKKFTIPSQAMAKIAAAQKARWARVKRRK